MLRQRKQNADDGNAQQADEDHPAKDDFIKTTAPGCIGLVLAVIVAAGVLRLATPTPKLFTKEMLSKFNGSDERLPIYLSILGSVFDVSSGKEHYGVGGGYHHFAGRDATRAFVSGNFTGDGLTDTVEGLSSQELKSLEDWRSFYVGRYMYIGKLIGLFYTANGRPSEELIRIERESKLASNLISQQEDDEKRFPTCNSRWSQNEGGEVWCSSGFPRLVQKTPTKGPPELRCACYQKKHLHQPGLQVYTELRSVHVVGVEATAECRHGCSILLIDDDVPSVRSVAWANASRITYADLGCGNYYVSASCTDAGCEASPSMLWFEIISCDGGGIFSVGVVKIEGSSSSSSSSSSVDNNSGKSKGRIMKKIGGVGVVLISEWIAFRFIDTRFKHL